MLTAAIVFQTTVCTLDIMLTRDAHADHVPDCLGYIFKTEYDRLSQQQLCFLSSACRRKVAFRRESTAKLSCMMKQLEFLLLTLN